VLVARFVDFAFNERDPLAALIPEEREPSAAERRLLRQLDHPARLRRRAEALAAALAAGGKPLLLVLEDLHWADADAIAVITGAIQESRALGATFVWTARPLGEAEPGLAPLAAALPTVRLELAPLSAAETETLARRLGEQDAGFIAQCVARAAGNPLFLVHLLQAGRMPGDALPGNLRSVVLARSDRLPAEERAALQAAAVLGPVFHADELAELLGVPRAPLEAGLRAGLVRPGRPLWEFSHALVHEAIYSSLLRARRRELHRRAAERFGAADAVRRAQHLDRAECPQASAAAYLEAARAEWARHGLEPALRLVRRGLELEPTSPLRDALLTLLAQVLLELGRTREAIAAFREALAGSAPPSERCAGLIGLADALKTVGDYASSLQALNEAERLAGEQALPGELGRIHGIRGNVYFAQFDVERCEAEHRAALQHAELAANPEALVRALNGLGDAAYARGRVRTAARWFHDARDLAQRHGLARQELAARALYGLCQIYLHRLPQGLEQADAALALAQGLHSVAAEVMVQCMRGTLLDNLGAHRELQVMLEAVLPKARAAQVRRFEAVLLRLAGLAALGLGERALALERLEAGLRLAREGALRFIGASILGGIALAADDASRREEAVREGLELLALGSVSHCHFNFYRDAIDAFLLAGQFEQALDMATRLERYAADEPLPWCTLHARRARALAALRRDARDPAARREAEAVRAALEAAGLRASLPLVERFLSS
jgi:tetratricopeptide (TPR) repeat protein